MLNIILIFFFVQAPRDFCLRLQVAFSIFINTFYRVKCERRFAFYIFYDRNENEYMLIRNRPEIDSNKFEPIVLAVCVALQIEVQAQVILSIGANWFGSGFQGNIRFRKWQTKGSHSSKSMCFVLIVRKLLEN